MTPLRKGVMASLKIKGGLGKWAEGLGALLRRKKPKAADEVRVPEARAEPQTEGERALWQAMGWAE